MKKNEMRLLVELIKNCSRSDRKLAKVLGTSQPTVTRMRNRVVKEGGHTRIYCYTRLR
jgi:DNA-binding Lrp family transcriptional regulator